MPSILVILRSNRRHRYGTTEEEVGGTRGADLGYAVYACGLETGQTGNKKIDMMT